ncbi:MAG: YeeE/YedE family protein [Pseudomonadota bacterium]|nr:YeeE/YedE family protein [Pseudomonadota bacterium]
MTASGFLYPAIGGAMIGLASILLLALLGRVMGVSGIYSSLLAWRDGSGWRLAFILGTLAAPVLLLLSGRPMSVQIAASPPALAIAGLMVGVGAGLGSGCTSGHGVCGISRLSPRSVAATIVFMLTGFATVAVMRHLVAGG